MKLHTHLPALLMVAATQVMTPSVAVAGDSPFSLNVGAIHVAPTGAYSDINELADHQLNVGEDTQLGITLDYRINQQWGLELIAATPFEHDIDGQGSLSGALLGSTKHLPPTLLAQYFIPTSNPNIEPFVGLGVNITAFFEEAPSQALIDYAQANLSGANVEEIQLDDCFGIAAQVGLNLKLNDQWGAHLMASWIDIESEAEVIADGAVALTADVEIDPTVLFVAVKYQF